MLEMLKEIVLEYVELDDDITMESTFKDELGMTSFDIVCFCADIESAFGVRFDSDDMRDINDVRQLVEFIELRQQKQGA